VTGYGRPEDIQAARQAGFDEHLVKPVQMRELRNVLGRIRDDVGASSGVV
jgi:two-component system CheB/CheR fusion protein